MTKSRIFTGFAFILLVMTAACGKREGAQSNDFDQLHKTVEIDNWRFGLSVENQSKKMDAATAGTGSHYLKATVDLSNKKSKKPLLHIVSDSDEDYEAKYKYLAFNCKDNLYIKYKNENIYPIGYLFEPSNGLSGSERLVYKFELGNDLYERLKKDDESVEYWYIDRLSDLGKICFTLNN